MRPEEDIAASLAVIVYIAIVLLLLAGAAVGLALHDFFRGA